MNEELFTGERFVPGINDNKLEIEHYQRYLSVQKLAYGKIVLDAACGEGYGSNILAACASKVVGIDLDQGAVDRAATTYAEKENLIFQQGNIEHLDFADHSFDMIVSFETIEHVPLQTQQKFLNEIARVLKEDGMLVMSTPNKEVYSDRHNYKNEFHIKEFYHDEFLQFLHEKFQYVRLYNQSFRVLSVIDSCDRDENSIAYYSKDTEYNNDGKYYIAIASCREMEEVSLANLYIDNLDEYEQNLERILVLQQEEEARNIHIRALDDELAKDREIIKGLQEENGQRNQHIVKLDADVERLTKLLGEQNEKIFNYKNSSDMYVQQITELKEQLSEANERAGQYAQQITDLEKQLLETNERASQYAQQITNLEKQLLETNERADRLNSELNELEYRHQAVMNSIGWRMVSFPGKMYEKYFPIDSPRRKRIKMASSYVKAVNWTNIKFVGDAFKQGGIRQVRKELHAFEYRVNGISEIPLEVPRIDNVPRIENIAQCENLVFEKNKKPLISIIIPVYNQFDYTYACLKSILKNSGQVKYEIIIADDVSDDLTRRIGDITENIKVIRNKENLKFLRNCNHAAKYAKGKYILFLNNDTQVQENWLQPLVDLIESEESIGMVGSKLIYPDGRLQEAGGIVWGDGHAWNYGNGQNPENPEFNYVKEADYISGAAIMIRADLWEKIGGFDERYAPAYCEDSDLAFEVRKQGYKLMYQPLSVVIHFEGKSNGTDTSAGIKSYQVLNTEKFADKWREQFKQQSQTEDDLFHARDRSQNKKTILVIDHYVPQYDKDAGSKTTWQYLKMFVRQGYNVKFIGDNFYQHEPYTTQLQQMGIEVLYGPWYANHYKQWILDNKDMIDIVYLNRPHITEKYIDFLKKETNIKCIYYGHDLHFLRLKREYDLCGDEKYLKESKEWEEKELKIMRQVDISYYPSQIEVDSIHRIDPSVNVKAITAYVYEDFNEIVPIDFSKREGILFVGGFGHPPNEDAVLWFVEKIYPLIRAQQRIPFYIVGSNVTEKVKRIKQDGIILEGFVTEEKLTKLYCSCKLVVIPLRYGAGVKGKVIEALYNGTPMVSTSVGTEGIPGVEQIIEVTDDAKDFAHKVLKLYNNNDKLAQTARSYQEYIKRNNSVDAVWNIIRDDF